MQWTQPGRPGLRPPAGGRKEQGRSALGTGEVLALLSPPGLGRCPQDRAQQDKGLSFFPVSWLSPVISLLVGCASPSVAASGAPPQLLSHWPPGAETTPSLRHGFP